MDKYEWRKKEKLLYLPKNKPEIINIPEFQFITIEGEGNPGSNLFSECIGVLYAISYTIKMTLKKLEVKPKLYCDYTVYPLEGIWDINDAAKKNFDGSINKDDLIFKLMIRQPDFIDTSFFFEMHELLKVKKPDELWDHVKIENILDGKCVQMLHIGSYDNEPESFKIMERFTEKESLKRVSSVHREIYLSDFRKVPVEKLKTVLRFNVE